ncbi:unnamed protein product [Durusdinium trenchii]|uniref:Caskin-2 n=2 Tax=Durusdinium trenchii TaxID=1381693 RepID=A0ABP0PW59_9DINO
MASLRETKVGGWWKRPVMDESPTDRGNLAKAKRRIKQEQQKIQLREFLKQNRFQGVDVSKDGKLYPIHVAAHLGDFDLVRLLLRAGADPEQEIPGSGGGGKAIDIAYAADVMGSHQKIIDLLQAPVKILPVRGLRKLVNQHKVSL